MSGHSGEGDALVGVLDSLKHQTERIAGRREGVALALSYIEEDQCIAREQAR